jgi:uncharacterized membrane protein YkgB
MFANLDRIDRLIASWMARHGTPLLRASLGIVFLWFGVLKVLDIGPAKDLVTRTVYWLDPGWFYPVLGIWEAAIGIGMLIRPLNRLAILLLFLQMPGTLLPLFLLPDVCFRRLPFEPTIEGQYIIKNLVLIAAAIVVGGAVRERRG